MLPQVFYGIGSERQLTERIEFDLLFRWVVGLGVDEAVWDHSSFSTNRERRLGGEIAAKFLRAILAQPRVKRLVSSDHFSVNDGISQASGTAEREAALAMLDRRTRRRRITLGADRAYDVQQFVEDLPGRSVTPHIAIDGLLSKTGKPRATAMDRRTTRHPGYPSANVAANVSRRCSAGRFGSLRQGQATRAGACVGHPTDKSI